MLARTFLAATVALLAHAAAHAAPVISPFAADLSFAAYSADQTAGGSAQAAFNGGYWNAGGWFTHWVQADMGTNRTLTEVRVTTSMDPGYTIAAKVYLSNTPIAGNYAALTPVAQWSGVSVPGEVHALTFAATTGRFLEIVATGGGGPGFGSWVALGDSGGRTNWIDPGVNPVPEPGSWALMLGGLAAVGSLTRRRALRRS